MTKPMRGTFSPGSKKAILCEVHEVPGLAVRTEQIFVGFLISLETVKGQQGPSVALAEMRQMRLVFMPACAASLRNPGRNADRDLGTRTVRFLESTHAYARITFGLLSSRPPVFSDRSHLPNGKLYNTYICSPHTGLFPGQQLLPRRLRHC